ncbi:MAG TPA: DUF115 domain-containing protein [Sediminispirochaeta sp.]|nr:DUF115 domain-containing protein [Sediminispirochaeta sp.]
MSFFDKNLHMLRTLYPRIGDALPAAEGRYRDASIEIAKSGAPTLRVDGRYVHSRHDPAREAVRFIDGVCGAGPGLGIFLGFGLGYQVQEFRRRFPEAPVLIVEESESLFRLALEARDLEACFGPGVSLLLSSPSSAVTSIVADKLQPNYYLLPLSALVERHGDYYQRVEAHIEAAFSRLKVNKATLKRFGQRWVKNLASNIVVIKKSGDVAAWRDAYSGIPALVTAAGPSLEESLDQIQEIQHRAVIVATDTSARALIERGVQPDFIIVVDPQYWNSRHLDGLELKDSILISESASYPSVFKASYRAVFLSGSVFPLGNYLEGGSTGRYKLGAGGSVATSAWDFARLTRADPIIMAGSDLGFPEKRIHFRGSYFEQRLLAFCHRTKPYEDFMHDYLHSGAPFYSRDYRGKPLLTDQRMAVYRQWFEEQLARHNGANTYCLSDRGLRVQGIKTVDIDYLLGLPEKRSLINEKSNGIIETSRDGTEAISRTVNDRLALLERELEKLLSICREGEELCRRLIACMWDSTYGLEHRKKAILSRLDELDREILGLGGRDLASFLINPILEEIEREANSRSGDLKSNIELSRRLYQKLAESVEFHMKSFQHYY